MRRQRSAPSSYRQYYSHIIKTHIPEEEVEDLQEKRKVTHQRTRVPAETRLSIVRERSSTSFQGTNKKKLESCLKQENVNGGLEKKKLIQAKTLLQRSKSDATKRVVIDEKTSPSVVFIQDLELAKIPKSSSNDATLIEDENAKLKGQYNKYWRHLLLFHLQVDVEGHELKPAVLGTSRDLRVGQNCFAIGNPYGYENTLTTGVVSGLGREIPSPNGRAIRGAIQTDAAINAGNSGGPLINSYGHVIGVNTATFTRKGTGVSSGVNFAIPIDTVVRTVPYLIVYGTPYSDRFDAYKNFIAMIRVKARYPHF
ncbi:hypothetical protein GH714_005483 [Hevea brasiliensis]|uniref:Peptidase S1 domain-containing protein n=1 Tax=Hevea brasiliensis TaxID=3981 RepID=A0A6A6LYJ4_HEVBR|nr:hypothetical protein GH714_005483 [Hevea brasiliensis]